jgi:hypothetical protein
MRPSLLLLILAHAVIPSVFGAAARAEPLEVAPGTVVLPMSGLEVVLPKDKRPGFTWNISGSYSLSNGGASYDGRDVVDEKVDGTLVAGNWVMTGHFDAPDCAAVLAGVDLEDAWTDERTLYRLPFSIRGGVFDFTNDLGKAPSVALCTRRADGASLLLQRFFLDRANPPTREAILASLATTKLLSGAATSWRTGRWGAVAPRRRPEVRDRGDVAAVRTVTLAKSGLTLAIPDDGYVWLVRASSENEPVDWLDRIAPALNEITVEVARLAGVQCAAVFAGMTATKGRPPGAKGLPAGWLAGPTLDVNGALERSACRDVGDSALVVGLFTTPDKGRGAGDFGPLAPLLGALSTAAAR